MDDKDKLKLERLNARYKRQNEAMREKYDRVSATLPKGTVKRIQALNLTVNGLINDLVMAELERLEMGEGEGEKANPDSAYDSGASGAKCPF